MVSWTEQPETPCVYLSVLQLLIAKAFGLVGRFAQPLTMFALVGFEVAFAPVNVTVALERQDMCGQSIEEPAVVAHDDGAAGKVFDRFFQSAKRVDVKIVGWFVEQKNIGAAAEQLG